MAFKRSENITLIAKELGSSKADAEDFVTEVWKILGEFVHSQVVLEAVRQIEAPKKITPQLVVCFIEPQTYGLDQIAEELGVEREAAAHFCRGVRGSLGKRVEYSTILNVIWKIEDKENIKPRVVASQIDIMGLIANELGVDRKAARRFLAQFHQMFIQKNVVDYAEILGAIQKAKRESKSLTPYTIAIWSLDVLDNKTATKLLGKTLDMNNKATKDFCKQVSQILGLKTSAVNSKMVLKSLWRIENRNQVSPESIASMIQQNISQDSSLEAPKKQTRKSTNATSDSMTPFEKRSRKAAQKLRPKLQVSLPKTKIKALKEFGHGCWNELTKERRYQVPSAGRAEIMPFATLEHLINLELVRFIQEGVRAPGVYIEFEFKNESTIGVIKIDDKGHIEGFHKFIGSDGSIESLIEVVALSYYRDLVTPGTIYSYEPGRGSPRSHSNNSVTPRKLPRSRSIPTKKSDTSTREHQVHNLNEWYETQDWLRHQVVGHTRWVRKGFTASVEKQQQAREAGVNLPTGYTWVIEHERSQPTIGLQLDSSGNLSTRTLFLPPDRASIELNELLA